MAFRIRPVAFVLFLAVTALARLAFAQAPSAQPGPVITVTTSVGQDGTRYQYEITQERADELPLWDQRASLEPPLSMSVARKAAEAWLTSQTPEVKTFELSNLSLFKMFPRVSTGPCALVGCGYYRMSFDPVVGGRRLTGGGDFTVVVLLDGSIVEPRVEKPTATGSGSGAGVGGPGSGTGGGTGPLPTSGQNSASCGATGGVYRPGNGVTMPTMVRQVQPQYTNAAMRAKIQGSVMVECVVNTDGSVSNVKVVRSLDSVNGLDQEAVKAARQWRFTPGTRMGVPVPVLVTLEMTFSLR